MSANTENQEKNVTQLFSKLSREYTDLLRHEIALAKAEMSEKISRAESGLVLLVAGGLVAFAGVVVLLGAAVTALALVLPLWMSALIVGGAVVVIGLGMLQKGRSDIKPANLALHQTARTLRDDKNFVKEHIR